MWGAMMSGPQTRGRGQGARGDRSCRRGACGAAASAGPAGSRPPDSAGPDAGRNGGQAGAFRARQTVFKYEANFDIV